MDLAALMPQICEGRGGSNVGSTCQHNWIACGSENKMPRPKYYDAAAIPLHHLLFRWQGTILPLVFSSASFWLLLFFHVCVIYLYETSDALEHTGELVTHVWTAALMPSSLVTFLLVFYCGNCYARYFQLYQHCIILGGACMEWTAHVQSCFTGDTTVMWNVARHMAAAVDINYSLLRSEDGMIEDEDYERMLMRRLLLDDEVELLRAYSGFKPFVPLKWGGFHLTCAMFQGCRFQGWLQTGWAAGGRLCHGARICLGLWAM